MLLRAFSYSSLSDFEKETYYNPRERKSRFMYPN